MNTNTDTRYELATPITFGTALGAVVGLLLGPAGAVAGFIVGAVLGFWFDKKESIPAKSRSEAPLQAPAKKSICH
jgi:membrane associated rhomboid family serine protease